MCVNFSACFWNYQEYIFSNPVVHPKRRGDWKFYRKKIESTIIFAPSREFFMKLLSYGHKFKIQPLKKFLGAPLIVNPSDDLSIFKKKLFVSLILEVELISRQSYRFLFVYFLIFFFLMPYSYYKIELHQVDSLSISYLTV